MNPDPAAILALISDLLHQLADARRERDEAVAKARPRK